MSSQTKTIYLTRSNVNVFLSYLTSCLTQLIEKVKITIQLSYFAKLQFKTVKGFFILTRTVSNPLKSFLHLAVSTSSRDNRPLSRPI